MFFIDIAVPRDVDPEMNKLDGIFVYDIDDLQQAVASHVSDRGKEAERAEAIIAAEVGAYLAACAEATAVTADLASTGATARSDREQGRGGKRGDREPTAALTRARIEGQHGCPRIVSLRTDELNSSSAERRGSRTYRAVGYTTAAVLKTSHRFADLQGKTLAQRTCVPVRAPATRQS